MRGGFEKNFGFKLVFPHKVHQRSEAPAVEIIMPTPMEPGVYRFNEYEVFFVFDNKRDAVNARNQELLVAKYCNLTPRKRRNRVKSSLAKIQKYYTAAAVEKIIGTYGRIPDKPTPRFTARMVQAAYEVERNIKNMERYLDKVIPSVLPGKINSDEHKTPWEIWDWI